MSPLTPQSRNEVSHAFKSGFDFGPDSQFTPPKSSEKKLIDQLHSIQEDESLFSELMVTTNDSDEENSKEWADHILKQQTQDLPPCELLADSLVSGSSPTVPDESQYQVVDTKALETSGSPSNQNDEMLRIFQVLRDGLREYIRQLSAAKADYVVMVRSDFLINYGGKAGCHLRTKMINEYLTMAKNDEELLCYSLSQQLGDMSILEDIRNLIRESDRRRKLYNKRKNIMIDKEKRAASTPINDVIPSPVEVSEKKRKPRIDTKFKGLSVEKIQIGYYNQDKLNAVADLTQILKAEESEQFVVDLRGKSMPLKACLEAIYSPELNFDHSMVYTKIPLNLSFDYSIDLESNRTVAYTESLLSVSSHLASDLNVSNDNFSRILQLRAVVRVYDNDMLVLRRTEQVTGHLLSDNNRMKVNLPLNSKYWSSLLNEYSNGSVGAGKFESLRITHTLYFDEDPSVIRTSPQVPIYSLIWEFFLNTEINYLPHSVSVQKKIELRRSLTIDSFKSNSFAEPQSVGNRGHKRTRSRSMTDLSNMWTPMQPPPVFQQIIPRPQTVPDMAVSSAPAIQTRFAINDPINMQRYQMHLQAAQIRAHQSQQISLQQQQMYQGSQPMMPGAEFIPNEYQFMPPQNNSNESLSSASSMNERRNHSVSATKSSYSSSTGVTPRLKEFQFEVTTIPAPAEFQGVPQSSPTSSTISAHSTEGHEGSKTKKNVTNSTASLPGMGSMNLDLSDMRPSDADWKFYYYNP